MKNTAGDNSLKCNKQEGFTVHSSNATRRYTPGADTRTRGRTSINQKQEGSTGSSTSNKNERSSRYITITTVKHMWRSIAVYTSNIAVI